MRRKHSVRLHGAVIRVTNRHFWPLVVQVPRPAAGLLGLDNTQAVYSVHNPYSLWVMELNKMAYWGYLGIG